MTKIRPLLLCAALLAACGYEAQRAADDTTLQGDERAVTDGARDTSAEPLDVSCDQYVDEGLAVGARTREQFRSELGEPRNVDAEAMPNRHNPSVTDTVFRLHYPGLTAQIRRPAAGGDMVEQVEVSDNRHLAYPQLGVGAAVDRIVSAFGVPRERTSQRLLYVCGREIRPEEPVVFQLANERVEEVRFTYYVD